MNQEAVREALPVHLRKFVKHQDYAQYTPQDHAVWRFVLHQLVRVLEQAAHPVYLQGLKQAGISLERIPSIDEMNASLRELGWAAVVVDGFIPPAVFMEFQALKVLPIALDMRSIEHILYTPAPDIVHESAGHAPFLVDVDYAEYLQRFGEIGMKAISTQADYEVYSAIRHLSIVKEATASTPADIQAAEQQLQAALAANDNSSEAARLSRLHWWTVEYGLVGAPGDYKIFGAGLLSSLGESVSCQDDAVVRKLPLSVEAVRTPYDITNPQPQLFVAQSCKHLTQVLEVFADGMAFRKGGAEGLLRAVDSAAVCTAQYNSGLQVSGRFSRIQQDAVGNVIYLATSGETQLACNERQLPGHGIDMHAQGFGSPVGRLKNLPRCLSDYCMDELRDIGIAPGQRVTLEFLSGVRVAGLLRKVHRDAGRNVLFSFSDCTVSGLNGEVLFEPAWGAYDMAVGSSIVSVWGGAADRAAFDIYHQPSAEATVHAAHDDADQELFALYSKIRDLREHDTVSGDAISALHDALSAYPQAWLPRLELHELARGEQAKALASELQNIAAQGSGETRALIEMGLQVR